MKIKLFFECIVQGLEFTLTKIVTMLHHFQRRQNKVIFLFNKDNKLIDQSRSLFPFME